MPKNWFKEAKKAIYKKEYIQTTHINSISVELDEDGDLKLTLYECESVSPFGGRKIVSQIDTTLDEEATSKLVKILMLKMGILVKGDSWEEQLANFKEEEKKSSSQDSLQSIMQIMRRDLGNDNV